MMNSAPCVCTADASRFTHGAIYHVLFDRPLAAARRLIVDLVPEGSTVLDIACGTGALCFELATRRNCRVVGVDLSLRMIEFAGKHNQHEAVRFVYGDATDLDNLEPRTFDYATVLFLLHELPRQEQVKVLHEALCLARKVVVVDSHVPLPRNLHGIALRAVEASGGPQHYSSFAGYITGGGIEGILAELRVQTSVVQRFVFWHGCREMLVLDGQAKAASCGV